MGSKARPLRIVVNLQLVKYLSNSGWVIAQHFLNLLSGLLVGVIVARYLGPEKFGIVNYALAISGIFGTLSRLGMDSILVREISRRPADRERLMATAQSLMLLAAVASIALTALLLLVTAADSTTFGVVMITSTTILFQTFRVVDFAFQAAVKAKLSTIARTGAILVATGLKIVVLVLGLSVYWIALANALNIAFFSLFLLLLDRQAGFRCYIGKSDPSVIRDLMSSAWPMLLSALGVMIYMRVDQVMIQIFIGGEALGVYSAAVRVYEAWVSITSVVTISVLPLIVELKRKSVSSYERGLRLLFGSAFWSSALVALVVTTLRDPIIRWTFGAQYAAATSVLAVSMWASAFSALGSVTARYLTVERLEKKLALRMGVAGIANVTLNLLLIPAMGINGAAVATFFSVSIANYGMNYFDSDLRMMRKLCNQGVLFRNVIQRPSTSP